MTIGKCPGLRVVGALLLLVVVGTAGGRPPECELSVENESVTGRGGEGLRASCRLRRLTSSLLELGSENSSLPLLKVASHVTALTLRCNRQVVFQSEIRPALFSELPRLEDLAFVGCKIIWLPDSAFSGLTQLKRLSIRGHLEEWPGQSLELDPHSFSNLNRLEKLDLSHNALWSLPVSTLCQLPSLTVLNITHNRLHHLSDLGLGTSEMCAHPLLRLHVAHNQLDDIPNQSLDGVQDLRFLSFAHNRIVHLSDLAFVGLSQLNHLDLSHNLLAAIPKSAFTDLTQLSDLNLSNNSIVVLPPRAFSSLAQLLSLNLSNNQLNFEPGKSEIFMGLIRLVVLNLSNNQLDYIDSELFKNLYSLQVLHLENNQIQHLKDNTFSGLANLHTLHLSNNLLSTVTSNFFQGLSVLTYLNLDNNILTNIEDKALDNCSSLSQLDISHNRLEEIPNAISHAKLLRVLDISFNDITFIEDEKFYGLSNLQTLYIHHNEIYNITRNSFSNLHSLKLLDISYNQIVGVEYNALEVVGQLKGLNITHNLLSDINGLVLTLENLQWLNASYNQLTWFDYAVILPNIEWMDLSNNQLPLLGNHYELQSHLGLKKLYVSFNNITEINTLSIPNGIVELHLQNNRIEYIASNTFRDKEMISLIDLSYNNISLLEESSLRISSSKKRSSPTILLLANNPLDCDCGADWLLSAANGMRNLAGGEGSSLPRIGDASDVKCRLPGLWQHALVPLIGVQPHQFLCTYRRHCFTLCHCCEFDACDCEQTCPRNCTCYHDHTWTHNVVDCGDGGWSTIPTGVPMDVTEAFMDGNKIGALASHALIGRKNLRVLSLNHSEVTTIQNRTFNGLKNLQVLRLDHNKLTSLLGYEFVHLHNLLELHLDFNNLKFLSNITFSPLRKIEVLSLSNNHLSTFPVWNLALNPFLLEISLHNNLWSCECSFLANLRAWLEANRIKSKNASLIRCFHNATGEIGPPVLSDTPVRCDHFVTTTRINSLIVHDYVMLASITSTILILILVGALLAIAYRRRLKLWAVSRYGKRLFEKSSNYVEERQKLFDAFVSHSAKDSTWVCGLLSAELEARGYRLCVVHRDCVAPSAPVVSQAISESINCSHRVLLVLSRNLVDGEWCRYDFKSPHVDALRGLKRKQIIVVVLDDVPRSELDSELAALVRSAAVTLYPRDPRFWDRLRRAMPSLRHRKRTPSGCATLNKAVNRPLVTAEHQNGPAWSLPETKSIGHATTKSLTINPYWETAVTTTISNKWPYPEKPERCVSSNWLDNSSIKEPPSPSHTTDPRETDHMYMSVSECGEVEPTLNHLHEGNMSSITGGPTSSSSDAPSPSRPLLQQSINGNILVPQVSEGMRQPNPQIFRRGDGPDYLTRSWIFHPPPDQNPPPPGQTYFV